MGENVSIRGRRTRLLCQWRTALLATCCLLAVAMATPLDDYVLREDGCFQLTDLNILRHGEGWTGHVWNFTSQCWLNANLTNRPVWWHYLILIVPDNVNASSPHEEHLRANAKSLDCYLYITGGMNNNPQQDIPSENDSDLNLTATIAVNSRTPAAVLYQVPNQPLAFPWDPWHKPDRIEDSAVSITWWHYLNVNHSEPNFVLELPMTKAGFRAMDAVQAAMPVYLGRSPMHFYVGGASKRGWTTWLVGAVDAATAYPRVKAIIPIVLDALNLAAFAHRQFQFYGGWTFALKPYWDHNVTANWDSPEMLQLQELIDPFFYRERLTMPKLAINAGGDEFQMPDDHRYWAHDMVGEMNLLMVKNADHSLAQNLAEPVQSASAFLQALRADYPRPNYTWSIDNATGEITVTTNVAPLSVDVAFCLSGPDIPSPRRDFRWAVRNTTTCGNVDGCWRPLAWNTTSATRVNATVFQARVPVDPPPGQWVGFFVELQWPNPSCPDGIPFLLSSPTSVLPNTMPYEDCRGLGCRGVLV